jgi:hypothetical protein
MKGNKYSDLSSVCCHQRDRVLWLSALSRAGAGNAHACSGGEDGRSDCSGAGFCRAAAQQRSGI